MLWKKETHGGQVDDREGEVGEATPPSSSCAQPHRAAEEARRMLDLFESVGATRFTLTWSTMDGQITRVRKHWSTNYIRRELPNLLAEAERNQQSLFVRPQSDRSSLIQLDDLPPERAEELQPLSFLTVLTSRGKAQAWLAVPATGNEDGDRDFRRRVKKAVRSDPMASGSVRIAGSINFKHKYDPDFPRVVITHGSPGLLTSPEVLEARGAVAAPEPPPTVLLASERRLRGRKAWPDYEQCLAGAPPNQNKTGPDRSLADFTWSLTALSWGWSLPDVTARLRQVSAKAAECGERYATATTQQASRALTSKPRQR